MRRSLRRYRPAGGPVAWLVAAGTLYAVAALVLSRHNPLGWDETVYVSQVDPRLPPAEFSSPRARGMSVVVAPLVVLTGSITALRGYLALLSAVLLVLAYGVWLRLRRDGVPGSVPAVALLLLSTLWVTLFYGPSAMPNLWVAVAGVAATGLLLHHVEVGRGRADLLGVAAALAAAAVVRPTDAVYLAAPLGLAVLAVRTWRSWARLGALVGGVALGWLPWVVEAQIRYDGLLPRLRRAAVAQSTSERFDPVVHLRALDGPILCRPCPAATHPLPVDGVLWWAAGAALVVVGVVAAHRRGRTAYTALPAFAAACFAGVYLVSVAYGAPRFLLPAYALAAIPAAGGLVAVVAAARPLVRRLLVLVAVAALLALHVSAQVSTLRDIERVNERSAAQYAVLARALNAAGVRPPCLTVGQYAVPAGYPAGCESKKVRDRPGDEPFGVADLERAVRTRSVALVQSRRDPVPAWAAGWRRLPLPAGTRPSWVVYVAPR